MTPELVRIVLQLVVEMPVDDLAADDQADELAEAIKRAADAVEGVYPGHTSVLDWTSMGPPK